MKKQGFRVLVCILVILIAVTLTACTNERAALQEQVDTLESQNAELQSTISSLRAELERTQNDLTGTRYELQEAQVALEAAEEAIIEVDDTIGPLAITYAGQPNEDMSWPFSYGELPLGLRLTYAEYDEEDEITWRSVNEDIFTIVPSEDGKTATVTPVSVGSAEVVATVGDLETRSWVRIT